MYFMYICLYIYNDRRSSEKEKHSFVCELSNIVEFKYMSPLISDFAAVWCRDDFWPLIVISFGQSRTYPGTYPG